ncbi:MAG: hypothetical protein AB8F74_18755, partial [Saprospiraceae bacterium]
MKVLLAILLLLSTQHVYFQDMIQRNIISEESHYSPDCFPMRYQETPKSTHGVFTKADYLEDLNQLVDSIKTYHPQPYEFISESDFDASVNQQKSMITDSTSIRQFS